MWFIQRIGPWVQETLRAAHYPPVEKTSFRVEIRCCQQDGTVVWMQCQSKVLALRQKRVPPCALSVVASTITAQKQVEKRATSLSDSPYFSQKKIATNAHLSYDEQINTALAAVSRYLNLPLGIVQLH